MDDEIELAPRRFHRREDGVDGGGLRHVAMADDQPVDLLGQRLDPLLERIALIGEGKVRAMRAAGLGDAPGDRAVVGDTHDQAALAAHESRRVRHECSFSPNFGRRLRMA